MSFPSSEYYYQFKRLKHHDLGEEAYLLLTEADSFRAMKKAKELVPNDKVSNKWKEKAYDEMFKTNQLKYQTYKYAHNVLLSSALTIAEATGDPYWGMGLNPQQTLECLMDYWPRENKIGQILMEIRSEYDEPEKESIKRKANSPLSNKPKLSKI